MCSILVEASDIVVLEKNNTLPIEQREALLILPGFGSMYHSLKEQRKAFSNKGYDLFIPDYIAKGSIEQCAANVEEFIQKHHLDKYKKLYVFSYIIGSWTLNALIEKYSLRNIAGIIYDRSPLQERAPAILVKKHPVLSKIVFGKLIKELAQTPYKGIPNGPVLIGEFIESKATKLVRKNRKEAEAMGPVNWSPSALQQDYDDFAYLWQDHDQMYTRFDVTAPEVLLFFKTGKFSPGIARVPLARNPFEKSSR
jgi:hypothetical protein